LIIHLIELTFTVIIFFMKKVLVILVTVLSFRGFAGDTTSTLKIINNLCQQYDDVSRQFHFEGSNLISQSSICKVQMPINGMSFGVDEMYSTSTVTKLRFISTSKNIYINCGSSPYFEDTVYFNITSRSIAERIVEEFNRLKKEFLELDKAKSNIDYSKANAATIITRLNELTKQYDPYIRTFYYNEDNKTLIAKSTLCTVVIPMKELISIRSKPSGNDYSVGFTCSDANSKCIYVICDSFNNPDKFTSITINNQAAADEIVRLFGYLKNKTSSAKSQKAPSRKIIKSVK
jgi:hypothetical protein